MSDIYFTNIKLITDGEKKIAGRSCAARILPFGVYLRPPSWNPNFSLEAGNRFYFQGQGASLTVNLMRALNFMFSRLFVHKSVLSWPYAN